MKGIAGATRVAALSLWLLLYFAPCSARFGWVITNSTCAGGTSCKKCVARGCSYYKCASKPYGKDRKRSYKDVCGTPSRYRGGNTKPPGFEHYSYCNEGEKQGYCNKSRGTGLIVGGCFLGFIGLIMCCPAYDWFFIKCCRAADTGAPKEQQLSVVPAADGTTDVASETQNTVLTTAADEAPVGDITNGAAQVNAAAPVRSSLPSAKVCSHYIKTATCLFASIWMLYVGIGLKQGASYIVPGCFAGLVGLGKCLGAPSDTPSRNPRAAAATGTPTEEQLSVPHADDGTTDGALETQNPVLTTAAEFAPREEQLSVTHAAYGRTDGALEAQNPTAAEFSGAPKDEQLSVTPTAYGTLYGAVETQNFTVDQFSGAPNDEHFLITPAAYGTTYGAVETQSFAVDQCAPKNEQFSVTIAAYGTTGGALETQNPTAAQYTPWSVDGVPKDEQLSVQPADNGTTDGALATQTPVITFGAEGAPAHNSTTPRPLVDSDVRATQVDAATPAVEAGPDSSEVCWQLTKAAAFLGGAITMLYFGVENSSQEGTGLIVGGCIMGLYGLGLCISTSHQVLWWLIKTITFLSASIALFHFSKHQKGGAGMIVAGCFTLFLAVGSCAVGPKRTETAATGAPKQQQLSVQPAASANQDPVLTTATDEAYVDDTMTRALVDNDAGAIQLNEATPVQPSAPPQTNSGNAVVCACAWFAMMAGFLGGSITMIYFGVKLRQAV